MAQQIWAQIVRESGAAAPLDEALLHALHARGLIGADGSMRVRARSRHGQHRPSGEPPTLSLETSADGSTWTTLLDLGAVDFAEVAADAVLPAGAKLRVCWALPERAPWTTYWRCQLWLV